MAVSTRLAGKRAVITAATAGIGFEIARAMSAAGAHVLISSRKEANVDAALNRLRSENLKAEGCVCHVGKADDRNLLLSAAQEKLGGVDILVSNAGVSPGMGGILQTTEDQWDKVRFLGLEMLFLRSADDSSRSADGFILIPISPGFSTQLFEINVKATFLLSKLFAPELIKANQENSNSSNIIVISSVAGIQPLPALAAYSVSKTALIGLVKALALELAPKQVRVNSIAPGIIKTAFSQPLWAESGTKESSPSVSSQTMKFVPMRRFGEAHEIAPLAVFLASQEASYMTGETVVVAGGMPPTVP